MLTSSKSPRRAPGGMEKTIIKVKAYLLEEPPEGPRRVEKNNYFGKCLPPRRAPGGPPEGRKKYLLGLMVPHYIWRIEDKQLICTNKSKTLSPNHLLEENDK